MSVEVVLALEPLLDDLHVQQAEEAAAEAEAERLRGLGLEDERGVVEAAASSSASRRSSYWAASVGKTPAKTIGFTSLKPGSGSAVGRVAPVDRVADLRVVHALDVRDDEADLARDRAR